MSAHPRLPAILVLVLASLIAPAAVHAACEVIPGLRMQFGGPEGAADRPFAAPGEIVEISAPVCSGTDPAGSEFGSVGSDHVITLAITPYPDAATTSLVAITSDCSAISVSTCSGKTVTCLERGTVGVDTRELSVNQDDDGSRTLLFQWPDEADLPKPVGPARIAVHGVGTATNGVECNLGDEPTSESGSICEDLGGTATPPIACIDRLSESPCTGEPVPTFPTFVALPAALDFREWHLISFDFPLGVHTC